MHQVAVASVPATRRVSVETRSSVYPVAAARSGNQRSSEPDRN